MYNLELKFREIIRVLSCLGGSFFFFVVVLLLFFFFFGLETLVVFTLNS